MSGGLPPLILGSVIIAVAVAAHLPDQLAATVLDAARQAFVAGMQLTSAVAAVIGVVLAVLVLVALRHQQPAQE